MSVVVRGEAALSVAPDAGRLTFSVFALEPSSGDALQVVARRTEALDRVLADHRAAVRLRRDSSVSVQPEWAWNPQDGQQRQVGWRAARTTTIEVVEPGAIGPLLAAADLAAQPTVTGPEWIVDPDHRVWDDVRAAAAADARRRATAYAGGLGVSLGPVVGVREPGVGGGGGFDPEPRMLMATAEMAADAGGSGPGGRVVEVVADDVTVAAAVEVTFSLAG